MNAGLLDGNCWVGEGRAIENRVFKGAGVGLRFRLFDRVVIGLEASERLQRGLADTRALANGDTNLGIRNDTRPGQEAVRTLPGWMKMFANLAGGAELGAGLLPGCRERNVGVERAQDAAMSWARSNLRHLDEAVRSVAALRRMCPETR